MMIVGCIILALLFAAGWFVFVYGEDP